MGHAVSLRAADPHAQASARCWCRRALLAARGGDKCHETCVGGQNRPARPDFWRCVVAVELIKNSGGLGLPSCEVVVQQRRSSGHGYVTVTRRQ